MIAKEITIVQWSVVTALAEGNMKKMYIAINEISETDIKQSGGGRLFSSAQLRESSGEVRGRAFCR